MLRIDSNGTVNKLFSSFKDFRGQISFVGEIFCARSGCNENSNINRIEPEYGKQIPVSN